MKVSRDPRPTDPVRPAKWVRVLVPALLILLWFAGASIGGPYFGKVSEVSSNDQTSYLPSSAEATKVRALLGEFMDSDAIPAVVVFASDTSAALSDDDLEHLGDAVASLTALAGVEDGVSPLLPADDGLAAQAFVPIATGEIADTVEQITASLTESAPEGVSVHVTGPAGFTADLVSAFSGIDGLLLGVALLAVLVILIAVYRSLLLPVAVLATSLFALTVALLAVWWLAKAEVLLLSGQTQGILFILVIGAATDYSLLYVARYREELRLHADTWSASRAALRGSFEPILASGGTVIAGLLCLLLSDLRSNSTLGPVAAIGIVFAMLSALTLLPSILLAFGRAAFWPRRPKYEPAAVAADHAAGGAHERSIWARLGRGIARRPRTVWLAMTAVLVVGCFGVTQLQASGVAQSELVLGSSAARDGQSVLGEHFPGGSGSPVYIVTPASSLDVVAVTVLDSDGVSGLSVIAADSPSGSAAVSVASPASGSGTGAVELQAFGPPGTPPPAPTEVDGRVLLQATLADAADSAAAEQTVRSLRASFAGSELDALVGGVTATAVDTNDASIHDRTLIIPVVLLVILVILMLLLRSIVAPLLLTATTVLSFGTALGVSALVFNGLFRFPGADPAVPLYAFVFLVALGIDYNIFLMTRVREEALVHGAREGMLRGLAVTGGVITSAGLVLAATFAALSVIPILFLVQIAFIVAFGVLLDTFLVRAVLVPALGLDVGRAMWWPSALSKGRHPAR